jgi:hypothetical protein
MTKRVALKVFAIFTVMLILASAGILAWQLLIANGDGQENNNGPLFGGKDSDKGGLFGSGLFSGKNDTTSPSVAPTTMPSAAPSLMPSEFEYNYQFNQCSSDATGCCNGVETLCDWPVSDILFGIPHNAMATKDLFLVPNQIRPIKDALKAGFRGINIDVCQCQGVYTLCHGFCGIGELDPKDAITSIVSFMAEPENQNEVLLLIMELNSDAGESVDLNNFYNTVLGQIDGFVEYLFVHDGPGEPWPTLGTLIANDTRLIVFHYNGPDCTEEGSCPEGLHYYFQYAQETPFELPTIVAIMDNDNSCTITRGAASTDGSFFAVNNFITPDYITEGTLDPWENQLESAAIANALDFATERLQNCTQLKKEGDFIGDSKVNMLYVDFWDIGDVVQVVQEHNQNLGIFSQG